MEKQTMKAYRAIERRTMPVLQEVAIPEPTYGEVLIKMGAVGICRTDLEVTDHGHERYTNFPFTMGHENAGWVEKVGEGVFDLKKGDPVVVSVVCGCGHCSYCLAGHENICPDLLSWTCGLSRDGGLAEYMICRQDQLVKLKKGANPVEYVPFADAGLTSYRTVDLCLPSLKGDCTAVVIGVGGLGLFAIQYIKVLTGARVIAVDTNREQLDLAMKRGADEAVISDNQAVDTIMTLTGQKGVNAVIDFVGMDQTLLLAAKITRSLGTIVLAGLGSGTLPFGWNANLKLNVSLITSKGGTYKDLRNAVALKDRGLIKTDYETYDFYDLEKAFDALRQGNIRGRAIIIFDSLR